MSSERDTCPHCRASIEGAGFEADGGRACPHCGGVVPAEVRGVAAPESVSPSSKPPGARRKRPAWVIALFAVPTLAAVVWAAVSVKSQLGRSEDVPGPAVPFVAADPTAAVAAATLAASPEPAESRPPGPTPREVSSGPPQPGMVPFAVETPMVPIQAMVARFQVYRGGDGDRPVVVALPALWTDATPGIIHGPHFGSLARLVMEQAVLGAARDDLGAATRVMGLGDAPPPGKPELSLVLVTPYQSGEGIQWTVRRGGYDGAVVSAATLPLSAPDPTDYPAFVAMAEGYARGAFAGGFKKAGMAAHPNAVRATARGDDATERLLDTLSFPAQFAALRALHESVRGDGESPERLGALVRGYANLGTLTEFHWTASNKLFKARALLYAQRMLARDPRSPWPLWHRAYALSLSGLHRDARADLDAARKLPAPAVARPAGAPAWVDLIDAYCRFDTARLTKAAGGPQGRLAQLLRFYTVENYDDSPRQTLDVAREALASDPECFRLIDALCQAGGIANGHQATVLGPKVLAATFPGRLLAMKGVPAGVAEAARGGGDGVTLTDALKAAGAAASDQGEPSWSVLGRLVKETRFVHVWRRVAFVRENWNVPVTETIVRSRPLIAGHPYRLFVERYGADPGEAVPLLQEARRKSNPADYELTALPFFLAFSEFDPTAFSQMAIQATRHGDECYRDLQVVGRRFQNNMVNTAPERLKAVSPDCPEAAALLIEDHWDEVASHATEWEKRYADHPAVLARLAVRYGKLGRPDDERRCLEQYNLVSPVRWSYDRLAAIHLAQGHPELWRATLEEFLKTPDDYALDHARVRVDLAQYFLRRGEYDKAIPYADLAARTGAGWAMDCAGQCHEAAGDLDQAESWFRSEAERYPVSFMQWFCFCKRTGHGDLEHASRMADDFFNAMQGRLSENQKTLAVFFYDLTDEPAKGLAFIQSLPDSARPTDGLPGGRLARWQERMFLARFADALGDAKARDAAWDAIARGDHPTAAKVAALLRDAAGGAFDRKAFDAMMTGSSPAVQAYLDYFAGRFLERHGKLEDAAGYWERSVAVNPGASLEPSLGLNALRSHGLPTGQIPADPALYLSRGGSHWEADRPDLALKDYDEAIRLDPKNPEAFTFRAQLHRAEGRIGPALKDFDEAIRLDPGRPVSFNNRGVARRGSGDVDGALSDFGRVIELAPKEPFGYSGRGITYVLQGNDEAAGRDIDRAIAAAPQAGFGYAARGLLSLARGKEAEAERLFQKAVGLDPGVAAPIETLKKTVKGNRPPSR